MGGDGEGGSVLTRALVTTDRGEATSTRVDITIEADELMHLGDALAAAVEDYVYVGPRREYERARDRMVDAARAWRAARAG